MENRELLESILHGREERNLEYKGCINWDNRDVKAHITKSALSMSNIRDGGVIVIGVEQRGENFQFTGLNMGDRDSFTQDGVSSFVNEFADPYVELTVSRVPYEGKDFILIQIKEFAEQPVICKRDYGHELRRGAIYTRTHRMPESAEVPGQVELREILDAAVEKGIRALYERIRRTGLEVIEPIAANQKQFEEQLDGL